MKIIRFTLLTGLYLLFGSTVYSQVNTHECECKINRVKAVTFEKAIEKPKAADANSRWLDEPIATHI